MNGGILPLLALAAAMGGDAPPPRVRHRRAPKPANEPGRPTPPRRHPKIRPAPLRIVDKVDEDARALDGRVFVHRVTGEMRAALWTPAGIEFHNPKTNDTFVRPYRKGLEWCVHADDVTPADEPDPQLAPLPPEFPAQPIAEITPSNGESP